MQADLRLLLVRHGETEWSREGRFYGRTNLPLTDVGLQDAQDLIAKITPFAPSIAHVSPALRAQQTVAPTLARLGIQKIDEPDLWEQDYGDWEGRHFNDVKAENEVLFKQWLKKEIPGPPGGEASTAVRDRAMRVVSKITDSYQKQTVLIVAHGSLLNAMLCGLVNAEHGPSWTFPFQTGKLTEVVFRNGRASLVGFNR